MRIPIDDPEKWRKTYAALSDQEKYDFFCQTMEYRLSDDFLEDIDIVDLLICIFEDLQRAKQHQNCFALYEIIAKNNPGIMLQNDFYYIDKNLIDLSLFLKETNNLNRYLASFKADPVSSIDSLIPVLDKLVFYGQTGLALDIATGVYHAVKESDKLIGGAECDFASVILMQKLQDTYEELKNGRFIDNQEIIDYLKKYDFEIGDILDGIMQTLRLDYLNIGQYEFADLQKEKRAFFGKLMLLFCKYMYEEKKVNFSASSEFWYFATENFSSDTDSEDGGCTFDRLFELDEQKFEDDIKARVGFISNKRPHGFAMAWGLQYLYDFLFINKFVPEHAYLAALAAIRRIKLELMDGLHNELWKYNFVHCWERPDSIDPVQFKTEQDLFEKTFVERVDIKEYLPSEDIRLLEKGARKQKYGKTQRVVTVREGPKIGRNDPCPCGSGKKYKKCCGKSV